MEVLEAIGGITIFFLVIYLLISNEDRKKEAYKRYVDFLGLGDEKLGNYIPVDSKKDK